MLEVMPNHLLPFIFMTKLLVTHPSVSRSISFCPLTHNGTGVKSAKGAACSDSVFIRHPFSFILM